MTYIAQLRTTDIERLINFYVDQLGFELSFRYEDFYAGIKIGDSVLHIKLVDNTDPSIEYIKSGDHFHLRFPVKDLDARHAELQRLGVVSAEILEQPWGREFCFYDPDGHRLYYAESE